VGWKGKIHCWVDTSKINVRTRSERVHTVNSKDWNWQSKLKTKKLADFSIISKREDIDK